MLTSSYSLLILTCPWRAFLIFSFHIIHTHAHLWGLVIVLFSPLPLLLHSQNLLCYSCFKVYRREFKMLQVLKVLPQLTEMKKSSRSDFFWQYLLPRTAIFMPSIMRRSSERLWIVWEMKKIPQLGEWNANWRHFRHNVLDEWLYRWRKHCFIKSFQLKSLPPYEKIPSSIFFNPSFTSREKKNLTDGPDFFNRTGLFLTLRHSFPFYFNTFVSNTFIYPGLYFPENKSGFLLWSDQCYDSWNCDRQSAQEVEVSWRATLIQNWSWTFQPTKSVRCWSRKGT